VTSRDRIAVYLEQIALLALEVSRNQTAIAGILRGSQAGAGNYFAASAKTGSGAA
jgi:hypothetical protein